NQLKGKTPSSFLAYLAVTPGRLVGQNSSLLPFLTSTVWRQALSAPPCPRASSKGSARHEPPSGRSCRPGPRGSQSPRGRRRTRPGNSSRINRSCSTPPPSCPGIHGELVEGFK